MIFIIFSFYNELNDIKKIFGTDSLFSFQKLEWDIYTKSYLPIVKEFMDEPLKGIDWCEKKRKVIKNGYVDYFNSCLEDLKVKIKKSDSLSKKEPIEYIINNIIDCNKKLRKSINLDEYQISRIIFEAPDFFNEDTIFRFKGSIKYKEPDTTMKFSLDTLIDWSSNVDLNSIYIYTLDLLKLANEFILMRKETTLVLKTECGNIAFGGKGDDIYKGDYALIVDYGGNDIYEVSGSLLNIKMIIDFEGDDFYKNDGFLGPAGSILGINILIDLSGNDVYRCGSFSMGSGFLGSGILIDKKGDDIYEGLLFNTGSGYMGIGLLFDEDGNDTYRGYAYTQGFAGVLGYGSLIDLNGNDVYSSGGLFLHKPLLPNSYFSFAQGYSIGSRPDYGGGIGFLYDKNGNDYYNAGTYAQGCSYWYSAGFLLDDEGEDFYNAIQYSQGAGIHLSYGLLYDKNGNDIHISRHGPSMGEGHDFAVGILIDSSGNDKYYVSGGIGIGLNNSVGLFIDASGNDVYNVSEKMDGIYFGIGDVNTGRGFEGIGIFLDLGGNDVYPEGRYKDDFIWSRGVYGIGWDKNSEVKEEYIKQLPSPDFKDMKIDEIFKIASEWGVGENQERVNNAVSELIRRNEEALEYIFKEKIGTKNSLEIRAIEEVIKKNKEKAKDYILKSLRSNDWIVRRNTLNLIYATELKEASDIIKEDIKKKDNEKILRTYISTLGKLKDGREIIEEFLKSKNEDVRIVSLQALGEIKDKNSLRVILPLLKDNMTTVRSTALQTLEKYSIDILDILKENYKNYPELLYVSGKIIKDKNGDKVDEILRILVNSIEEKDDRVRYFAALGLYYSEKNIARNLFGNYYIKENNKFIRDIMKRELNE